MNLASLGACLAPLIGVSPPSGEPPELIVGHVTPPLVGLYRAAGATGVGTAGDGRPVVLVSSTLNEKQRDGVTVRLTVAWLAGLPLRAVTRAEANVKATGATEKCLEVARG